MDIISIGEIAKSGMSYERSRVQFASSKLAMASMAYGSSTEASQAANELIRSHFFSMLRGAEQSSNAQGVKVKQVQDPGHPKAGADGIVYYLDIDPVHEMATLVSALRSYEANVRAYNVNSDMNRSALSIGGKQ